MSPFAPALLIAASYAYVRAGHHPHLSALNALAEFADERHALRERPMAGDVFLQAYTRGRFARMGIVVRVLAPEWHESGMRFDVCDTIEVEPAREFARVGSVVVERERWLSAELGDRFIRLTLLGSQELSGRSTARHVVHPSLEESFTC